MKKITQKDVGTIKTGTKRGERMITQEDVDNAWKDYWKYWEETQKKAREAWELSEKFEEQEGLE